MRKSSHSSGFTLIELAIVLVVVGLLAGGILVGRDMMFAAKMRQQWSDIEKAKVAMNTFRLKYNCLPGDCINATDFFTKANDCLFATHVNTCNGNGNGFIGESVDANIIGPGHSEDREFTKHLAFAQLIPWPTNTINYPAPSSFLGTTSDYGLYAERGWWPNPTFPAGYGYWWIRATPPGSATNGPASRLLVFERKYDDENAFTGNIKIVPEEFDTNDPASCIDSSGNYRLEGMIVDGCSLFVDFPY